MLLLYNPLPDSYITYFKVIQGVRFTSKELDIIACLLTGRRVKEIALLLSNSPKTIDNHISNIMEKLSCNTRKNIIDFIERSGQLSFFRYHYQHIAIQSNFLKCLSQIYPFIHKQNLSCLLVCLSTHTLLLPFLRLFESHLTQIGIQAAIKVQKDDSFLEPTIFQESLGHKKPILFISPFDKKEDSLLIQKKIEEKFDSSEIYPLFIKPVSPLESLSKNLVQENLSLPENYYFSFFEILKNIFPFMSFSPITSNILSFEKTFKLISHFSESSLPTLLNIPEKLEIPSKENPSPFPEKKRFILLIFLVICIGFLSFFLFKSTSYLNIKNISLPRSDLIIPKGNAFLKRPDILEKMDELLNRGKNIETIVLVGVGGAGKTTLSRYYGRTLQNTIVWELNAENKNSLITSFMDLAYSLAKTKEQKESLEFITHIQDPQEKEKQLLSFVKQNLKEQPGWLLIYDNVETFADIKSYFPQDSTAWGNGKVIITTRNSNIQNSSYLNPKNIIQVGQLTEKETLTLFSKIFFGHKPDHLSKEENTKALSFLKYIPPFPLDVSLSARHLKSGGITYEKYLELMAHHSKEFETIQETLLQESSDSTKTRYSIISLSLEKILNIHPAFKELMLLICLFDSQDIPINFLKEFKEISIVENFIYHLKKFSFVVQEAFHLHQDESTFSIHRSTQEISLEYLARILQLKTNDTLINSLVTAMESYIDKIIEEENATLIQIMIKHCKKVLSYSYLLSANTIYSLKSKLGNMYYYSNAGSYAEAKNILEENIASLKESKNLANKNSINDLIYLGLIYSELDEREKLKEIADYTLQRYKDFLSENTIKSAWALSFLGNMYDDLGDYTQAKELLEKSCFLYKNYFPKDHAGLARTLAYLGNVYRKLGEYQKAQKVLEESYQIYKKDYSGNHFRTGWVLVALGNVYLYLGTPEKAASLLQDSVKIYKEYFPNSPSDACWPASYLANSLIESEQYKEAKNVLKECLKIYNNDPASFPDHHDSVARALSYLGKVYLRLKKYEKAKFFLDKSLTAYQKNFGKFHLETGYILASLGELNALENKLDIAESTLQQALQIFKQNNHTYQHIIVELLSDLYYQKYLNALTEGKEEEAAKLKNRSKEYLSQALQFASNHFSENSIFSVRLRKKQERFP